VALFEVVPDGAEDKIMTLLTTPLDALHRELGAKMVPFAGYDMPVQYPSGIIKEHLHTRRAAGLFDVSHMGQVIIEGEGTAAMLESLVPVDIEGLGIDRQTYALFTNEQGGVSDDLIITRWGPDRFFLVVNAACKEQDIAHLRANLCGQTLAVLTEQALLALQGPAAREVMRGLCPAAAELVFMQGLRATIDGSEVYITCSGYTGEDGFEISVPAASADALARTLLAVEPVQAIGLGARDSLRLEAGLCLYGHELTNEIDPVQAGLMWSISKARRADGTRPGGFPGADIILQRMIDKPTLRRVGLTVEGKRPVRDGQPVMDDQGRQVGEICSAGYGASVGGPVAMAYISRELGEPDTKLAVDVRGKLLPVTVTRMPFSPQHYYRG
jgi:aminomethyltransferase